jgi:hypothetical protein
MYSPCSALIQQSARSEGPSRLYRVESSVETITPVGTGTVIKISNHIDFMLGIVDCL